MDRVAKIARQQREILVQRIQMLEAGIMKTSETIGGRVTDTTAQTLTESRYLLATLDNFIADFELGKSQ